MKVYRLEYLDGGGPWFRPDGTSRNSPVPSFPSCNYKCGCASLVLLEEYMKRNSINPYVEDTTIFVYEIKKAKYISPWSGEIDFDIDDIISKSKLQ